MNIEEKKQNILQKKRKKSFSVFKEAPYKPFKHTMTFFPQNVFLKLSLTFIKNAFDTN